MLLIWHYSMCCQKNLPGRDFHFCFMKNWYQASLYWSRVAPFGSGKKLSKSTLSSSKIWWYSKASRYKASSFTDLTGAHFWIGSKKIWDERIYVVKLLSSTVFWSLSHKSCTNFELHKFFLSPKYVHLKALLYWFTILKIQLCFW